MSNSVVRELIGDNRRKYEAIRHVSNQTDAVSKSIERKQASHIPSVKQHQRIVVNEAKWNKYGNNQSVELDPSAVRRPAKKRNPREVARMQEML